jgi:hypothetical protein
VHSSGANHCNVRCTNKKHIHGWLLACSTWPWESGLVWCDAVSLGGWYLTYWRNIVSSSAKVRQPSTVCNPLFPSTNWYHCVSIILLFSLCGCLSLTAWPWKMKALNFFKMWGGGHPMTQCHIPGEPLVSEHQVSCR